MLTTRQLLISALLAGSAMVAHAGPVAGQGTWETTLQARDINGDSVVDAYYDTSLNVTWLADWNASVTPMNWGAATAWAAGLDVYGKTGWRLPSTTDIGSAGCNFSYAGGTDCGYNVDTASSEMAHMFYVTLGNKAYCPPGDATCAANPQPGFGLTNTANFVNVQSGGYWSGTQDAPSPGYAWYFSTSDGSQLVGAENILFHAVAVRPGDVAAAVPEPQTLALALVALGAAMVVRKRPV